MVRFWDAVASAGHMQTICTSPQTDNHINTPSLNFYRLDAGPDARYAGTQKGQMYDENNSLSWTRNSHIGVASRETWECKTHTHTHQFNGPFSGTTRVSRYQKGKTNLHLTEALS